MIKSTKAVSLLSFVFFVLSGGFAQSPQKRAQDILEATGIRGGLVVHLGCGDGNLTIALRANQSYMVHGLDADAANVRAARKNILAAGLYGTVSADRVNGRLPYTDNMINLIVAEKAGSISNQDMMRVLVPGGVIYTKKGNSWQKTTKPVPSTIDEWTHYLHDASSNAVAHDDVVGPPRHLQWIGSPRWSRHHDRMASMSALVSTGGRVFYIQDEGS
ncbi:MAG: class I SAM-dependent methyltransferase, partial [Planctomycetota bacterium]|nr:class I SAM-dependent methyltransferase [Planctomycetota bacterium]